MKQHLGNRKKIMRLEQLDGVNLFNEVREKTTCH